MPRHGLSSQRVLAQVGDDADKQDCECDEGCYYCMVTLKLKVSYMNGEPGNFMSVTSDMLEVIPSPNGVSYIVYCSCRYTHTKPLSRQHLTHMVLHPN